ncbi:uncharacterized protein LOC117219327 isoform X2 [Megalopta genalis]|uniref:uncharacterized protein LOC117219327 isoform X2 n=1 Tax=Megalopta genalis TaxID=115081 RepID=UPI003FD38052
MFGRQLFLESVDDRNEQWRRNECLRQLVTMRTQQGPPIAQLTRMPLSRNDGFTLDLNLIVLDDPYLRAPRINTTDQYLLEYIRQMEERYAAMERELTRTKMMLPLISRNTVSAHQSANVNWKECSLANKYGSNAGKSSESRRGTIVGARDFNQNRERTNVFSRRMRHARQEVDSTVDRTNWRNCGNSFQNDVYPIRDPASHGCRPRTWGNNSAAVCSTHNVAMIIPQDPISPPNVSRHDQTRPRPDVRKYFSNGYANARLQADNNNILEADSNRDAAKMFDGSAKSSIAINTQKTQFLVKTALMEACQRSDEKQEPETSRCIDSDVKHEDYKQAGFTVNGSILPTTAEPKLRRENSERKPASTTSAGSSDDLAEKRALKRIKYFENSFARREENRLEKLQQERIRSMNEQARNLARMIQRNARAQKRVPTPRSNVHTACTPMMQPVLTNQMLDPNGMTIRLLRLAVLLYAPALLPALNSLIAQQSSQTTIPIPCFDGSNDLLTQLLRVLGSQQRVPNLSYTASPRSEETPQNPRVASSSSPRTMSNPEPGFQRQPEGESNFSTNRPGINPVDASSDNREVSNDFSGQCNESCACERTEEN